MQISIVEQEIIEKERQQMQMEEIRSYIDMEYYQTPQPLKQKLNTFKYPNELTYKKYISKPQKIDNNQFMYVRQNILYIEGNHQQTYQLSQLNHIQMGRKLRLGLTFGQQIIYVQAQTDRKQSKLFEAYNYFIQNKTYK